MVTRRVKRERDRERETMSIDRRFERAAGMTSTSRASCSRDHHRRRREGETTKTSGSNGRDDAPSPRRLGGGGGVFARRGVLGVLGLVLFERTYEAARYPGNHRLDVAARLVSNATTTRTKGGQRTTKRAQTERPRGSSETKRHHRCNRGDGTDRNNERGVSVQARASSKRSVRSATRKKRGKRTNGRRTREMTRKKTVNRGNI